MRSDDFLNKVVVVTGASAGLGRAIAVEFARHGACLALIARNHARLEKLKQHIEGLGGRAWTFVLDVADAEAVENAAGQIEQKLGAIDIWVNNAMVSVLSPVRQMRAQEYRRVMEVNFLGMVHGTLAAFKRMQKKDRGVIIQVGSTLAYRGIPLQSAYCASKHAIQGFHDSFRAELLHEASRIQVSMVQMPALNTPQFDWIKSRMPRRAQPVPPIFQPEVGAKAVLWAAGNECRELNVSFLTSLFILGNKFFPGFGDWYLARKGYQSQQTDQLEDPQRPDNLWRTVDGDFGAHGRFNGQSNTNSPYLWVQTHLRPRFAVLLFISLIVTIFALRGIAGAS